MNHPYRVKLIWQARCKTLLRDRAYLGRMRTGPKNRIHGARVDERRPTC